MLSTHGASRQQAELFTRLYADEKKPLRAAAAEVGIDIITATMLAQQTGHIRFKTAERKLAEGCFIHSGSAMMNWVVGNARVEPRANGILITKQASGSAKIDPLMAMFDAVSLLSLNPTARGASVYETRGIRML